MKLLNEIKSGESKILELKERFPKNEQIAKTAVAFSNTAGGKIIIGVSDNRDLFGLDEEDIFELQDKVSSIIYDSCYPNIIPEIYTANIDGKILLVVEIFVGTFSLIISKERGKITVLISESVRLIEKPMSKIFENSNVND